MKNYELFYIEHRNYIIIPLSYNTFLYNKYKNRKVITFFDNHVCLPNEIIDILEIELDNLHKNDYDKIFILDFFNISVCNRIFSECNKADFIKSIVFANIEKGNAVKNRIKDCIPDLYEELFEDRYFLFNQTLYFSEIKTINFKQIYDEYIYQIFKKNDVIINHSTEYSFLESSGIYANYYLSIKNIFLNTDSYLYIVYRLSEYISKLEYFNDIDALISTSKTGGIIATIVGSMLDKKVIHCMGIGPKNVADIEKINEKIRSGKNYFLVLDFICLGTEVKIINTIVTCLNADIKGGVSLASYVNFENNKDYNDSPLNKLHTLININKTDTKFKISINREKKYDAFI